MATRIWGMSGGEPGHTYVTEGVGSAVSADTVELTVDLADSLTREQVLEILEAFKTHILQGIWPPA